MAVHVRLRKVDLTYVLGVLVVGWTVTSHDYNPGAFVFGAACLGLPSLYRWESRRDTRTGPDPGGDPGGGPGGGGYSQGYSNGYGRGYSRGRGIDLGREGDEGRPDRGSRGQGA